jgi:tRNA pseudouridine65 synthase
LVVNKPAGLLVHRTSMAAGETDTLLDRVAAQLLLRSGRAVRAVHRLDRATSGAIVLARTAAGASALCEAFRARQPRKWYICVVRGWMGDVCGVIDAPLSVVDGKNERRARHAKRAATLARSEADEGDGGAAAMGAAEDGAAVKVQAARTEWRQIATVEAPFAVGKSAQHATTRYALVAASPHTGRTHQIRRHLKKHGHPIVGDARYGDLRHSRAFRERLGSNRLLLHARSLRFRWPGGAECAVVAPLPPPMLELFAQLGWPSTEAAFDAAFGAELRSEDLVEVGAVGR